MKELEFATLTERQIHDATRHVLESTYLMANSKEIDTIIGRYKFLEECIGTVRKASRTELGNLTIHEGIVLYEDQHDIHEIESYQDGLLFHSDEDARKVFFAKTLLIGLDKHYEEQMGEIAQLKMDHAIVNRHFTLGECKEIFMEEAIKICEDTNPPLVPVNAWEKLKSKIEL